jgi:hypothetical protein
MQIKRAVMSFAALIALSIAAQTPPTAPGTADFFVSSRGKDTWSGKLADPVGNDGPFATVARARDATGTLLKTQKEPRSLRVVLHGGRRLGNGRWGDINGRKGWVVNLAEVKAGTWRFRQLFVNGERRPRTRLPKQGEYRIESLPGYTGDFLRSPTRQVVYAPGNIVPSWHNLRDVEVVAITRWLDEGANTLYRHGFLKVSDNRRHLAFSDGTPFLWLGDTVWAAPQRASEEEWEAYLGDRTAKHFTVIQVGPASEWAGPTDRRGEKPFTDKTCSRWNPAYWQAFEQKVQRANEADLVVLLVGLMEPGHRYPKPVRHACSPGISPPGCSALS